MRLQPGLVGDRQTTEQVRLKQVHHVRVRTLAVWSHARVLLCLRAIVLRYLRTARHGVLRGGDTPGSLATDISHPISSIAMTDRVERRP